MVTRHQSSMSAEAYVRNLREIRRALSNYPSQRTLPPLGDQLRQALCSMAQVTVHRPWSIGELTVLLQGRYRRHPHAQHVARALRELGWTRKRDWSQAGDGRRYWYPPEADDGRRYWYPPEADTAEPSLGSIARKSR